MDEDEDREMPVLAETEVKAEDAETEVKAEEGETEVKAEEAESRGEEAAPLGCSPPFRHTRALAGTPAPPPTLRRQCLRRGVRSAL